MEIEEVKIENLHEYGNNVKRHPAKQIKQIMKSITDFGFNDPIAIDENNVIIEGHGRLRALKELGWETVPCIRLKHLSDEQKRAYILIHNKLNMETGFDDEGLYQELSLIEGIDMKDFGFDLDKVVDGLFKENERVKTNNHYNMDLIDLHASTQDFWQMPIIQKEDFIPEDLIGFNYAITNKEKNVGIHFYVDDYQFERLWNRPQDYVSILEKYDCILSPDFSLYMDMPMPMKIWNIYRSRLLGQYYQNQGITVIPTVSWAEKDTFEFCFKGIEKGSIVSISTLGVKKNKEAQRIWREGVDEMIKQIEPSTILVYGGELEYDYKDIPVKYYTNKVTERMKENGR